MTTIKRDLPKTVQEAGEIQLHGTLIDDGWFQHLRFDNGEPYMIAILVLSEIFYWYKPTVIKDENSGKIIEMKKKFNADKLQKDYKALGAKFGVSTRTAKSACYFLRDRGLITIELRTVPVVIKGKPTNLGNVTFFEPVLDNIRKISCMCKQYSDPTPYTFESISPPCTSESISPCTFESTTLHRLPSTKIMSNTEGISNSVPFVPNIVKNNIIKSPSVRQSVTMDDGLTDGLEEILKVLDDEYLKPLEIRPETLKSIEGIITHLFYVAKPIEISGASYPPKAILKTLKQLTPVCIEHTVMKYEEYSKVNNIINSNKYLQTVLYNSVYDEGTSMTSEINYKIHGNGARK